jgi:hypothetical protein
MAYTSKIAISFAVAEMAPLFLIRPRAGARVRVPLLTNQTRTRHAVGREKTPAEDGAFRPRRVSTRLIRVYA